MDEILIFIVLWVVLYLINLISKKIKKQETAKSPPVPAPPVTQTPGPPIWNSREPESIPSHFPQEQLEKFETDEEYFEEEEELVEQEVIPEETKKSVRSYPTPPPPEEPLEKLTEEEINLAQRPAMTLKQYVIWKEILDKPLSLRPQRHINKNRVS